MENRHRLPVLFALVAAALLLFCSCPTPVTPSPSPSPSPTPTPTPTPVLVLHGPEWPSPANPAYTYDPATADPGKQAGLAAGLKINYTGFTMSAVHDLWWTLESIYPPQLSFTGSDFEANETLIFSEGDSDLDIGVAVWTGTIEFSYYESGSPVNVTLPVRCTITLSGAGASAFHLASELHEIDDTYDTSAGVVAPVTGDMNVLIQFEAYFDSTWQPAVELFDGKNTNPSDQCMISFGPAFTYTVYE